MPAPERVTVEPVMLKWPKAAMLVPELTVTASKFNTQNLQDYPVSLYGYTQFQLTRIAGWND